jgi:hypothetical protein
MRSLAAASFTAVSLLGLAGCERWELDQQMGELCKKDGGVKVHETVPLPAGEFSKDGIPFSSYWRDSSLVGTTGRLGPNYRYLSRDETIKAGDPMKGEGRLTRYVEEIYRIKDGRLLGSSVWYGRSGGDFIVLGHFSTAGCPVSAEPLLTAVFVKEKK